MKPLPGPSLRVRSIAAAIVLALGLGWGLWRTPAPGLAQEGGGLNSSPCRLQTRLELDNKLVCPLQAVTLTLHISASCPREADGWQSQVVALTLEPRLAADLRGAPLPQGAEHPASDDPNGLLQLGPLPPEGLSLPLRVLALRSGLYPLGQEMRLRLRDDRGRGAEASVAEPVMLAVSPCAYGGQDRVRRLYLPLAQRPACQRSVQAADIVLAIDRSTSMGAGGLALTLEQAADFIQNVDLQRDRVALLAFDTRAELASGLTGDRTLLLAALRGIRPGRLTALDRALDAGALVLGPGGGGRRRVLALVSDGHQTGLGDEDAVRAAAARARRQGIRILTLAVEGGDVAPNWALLRDLSESPSLAVRVRGSDDPSQISQAFRDLAELAGCGD